MTFIEAYRKLVKAVETISEGTGCDCHGYATRALSVLRSADPLETDEGLVEQLSEAAWNGGDFYEGWAVIHPDEQRERRREMRAALQVIDRRLRGTL